MVIIDESGTIDRSQWGKHRMTFDPDAVERRALAIHKREIREMHEFAKTLRMTRKARLMLSTSTEALRVG